MSEECSISEKLRMRVSEYLSRMQEGGPADEKHSIWIKLYAATERLSGGERDRNVQEALVEICSNLLACEELALVEINRETLHVRIIAGEGLTEDLRIKISQNAKTIEQQIELNSLPSGPLTGEQEYRLGNLGITAIVPLWITRRFCAAMILFRLLPQRTRLEADDIEVLQMLCQYAGPSLRSQTNG